MLDIDHLYNRKVSKPVAERKQSETMRINKQLATAFFIFSFLISGDSLARQDSVSAQTDDENPEMITIDNADQLQLSEIVPDLVSSGQIAYSPSGDYVAVATEAGVQIYSKTLASEFQLMETEAPVYSVAFSSDGLLLAGGDYEGRVYLWEIGNEEAIAVFDGYDDDALIREIAFFDNNNLLMSRGRSSGKTAVKIWDLASKTNITTITDSEYLISAAIPNTFGKFIVTVDSEGSLQIFDSDSGQLQLSQEKNLGGFDLQFSPDQSILASAGVYTVTLTDWQDGDRIATLDASRGLVSDIAFNADGTLMATGDTEGEIHIWDVKRSTALTILESGGGEIVSLVFSPDGSTLISNDADGLVYVWQVPAEN